MLGNQPSPVQGRTQVLPQGDTHSNAQAAFTMRHARGCDSRRRTSRGCDSRRGDVASRKGLCRDTAPDINKPFKMFQSRGNRSPSSGLVWGLVKARGSAGNAVGSWVGGGGVVCCNPPPQDGKRPLGCRPRPTLCPRALCPCNASIPPASRTTTPRRDISTTLSLRTCTETRVPRPRRWRASGGPSWLLRAPPTPPPSSCGGQGSNDTTRDGGGAQHAGARRN